MTSGLITLWKLEAWVLVTGKNPGKLAQETHLALSHFQLAARTY